MIVIVGGHLRMGMGRRIAFVAAAASVMVAADLAAEVAARGERLPSSAAEVAAFVSGGDWWRRVADERCWFCCALRRIPETPET